MAFAQGMFEALYGGFETSFKTLPGTPTADKEPVINPAFRPAVNMFQSEALTGSAEPRPVILGKVGVDLSFELEASKESLTMPLKGLFGAPTSAGTTGYYDHYYVLGTQPSMFFEQRHTDISQNLLWKGCYIGEGQFNFESEGLCRVTFSGMGATQTNEGSSTVITGTITDKTGQDPLNYMDGAIKENDVTLGYVQSVNFRINRRLDKRNHIDATNEVGVIFSQVAEVTGTVKASFQDKALLDKALASTETSMECTIYSLGHGLRVLFPTVKFKPTSPITNGTGLADIDFEFTAYARGTASDIAGEVCSKYFTTLALSGLTLIIATDGAADQTVTFAAADDTPTEAAAAINTQTTLCTASVENGRVVIRSDTKGTTSSVKIQVASTADITMGYDNVVHNGYGAKSVLMRVSNASATVQA